MLPESASTAGESWAAARDDTLGLWRSIRRMIDTPDELELLTEINAVCAMCEAASVSEPKSLERCERCLFFQQFGGCHAVNLEMSERVVNKDWNGLRRLVDEFIVHLTQLDLPAGATPEGAG